MISDEMVEKTARAIADADGEDYMEDYRRFDKLAKAAISAVAPAIRAAALEEAAKVADEFDEPEQMLSGPETAQRISVAIRALKDTP